MRCKIVDAWLEIDGRPAPQWVTPNIGGRMRPSLIVLHDTAGRLTRGSSVAWFMDRASRVSAHFVVERDGSVTQLAACDRQAWHAGVSEWKGRRHVNGFSVGIEIVNPGKLTSRGAGKAVAWFGEVYDVSSHAIEWRATDQHGDGLWMPYTDQQIATVESIVAALADAYPSISEVVGHYQISPGRKVDPNPLLPARLLGPISRPRIAGTGPAAVIVLQSRLRDLGYFPGAIDGTMGPRTEAALFAFQTENQLNATGKIDPGTGSSIMNADAKPMPTASREWITEADLAGTSRTVDEQSAERREGQVVVGIGALTTLATAFSDFGHVVQKVIADFGPEVVLAGLGGVLAAYGVRSWRRASRTIGYRVEDAQTGVHAGNVGGK